jgi:hypothetical protein
MWGWQLPHKRRRANSSVGSSFIQRGKKVWLQRGWKIRSNLDKCLNSTQSLCNIIMKSWNLMLKELEDNFKVSVMLSRGGKELKETTPYTPLYFQVQQIYIYIYVNPIKILSRNVHIYEECGYVLQLHTIAMSRIFGCLLQSNVSCRPYCVLFVLSVVLEFLTLWR